MGVAGVGDVFRRCAEFHCLGHLRDHRAGQRGNAPYAQHPVGLGIGNHLHEAIGLVVGLGAAVGHHRELADLDLTAFAGLLFGQADAGKFGVGIDYAWDQVMIHDARQPGDILSHGDAFVLGLVGQHRSGDAIADRPDAINLGAEIVIGFDLAARIQRQTNGLDPQAGNIGAAADGHQHAISLNRFGCTALGRFNRQCGLVALDAGAGHLGAQLQLHALLLEDLGGFLADIAVHAGQQLVQEFNHGDLGAQAAPDRAHFQPDHAAADHHQVVRHLRQGQRAGAVNDHALIVIDLDARQRGDAGTGGDHHVLGGVILARDGHGMGVLEGAITLEPIDLVLLEQVLDPAGQSFDRIGLIGLKRGQIEFDLAQLHAITGQRATGRFFKLFRPMEQRLRRNAADVEAGTAQRFARFHASRLQAQLRRADCADIAAGTGADEDHVIIVFSHFRHS